MADGRDAPPNITSARRSVEVEYKIADSPSTSGAIHATAVLFFDTSNLQSFAEPGDLLMARNTRGLQQNVDVMRRYPTDARGARPLAREHWDALLRQSRYKTETQF